MDANIISKKSHLQLSFLFIFLKTRLIIIILSFLVYHTIKPYLCYRQIILITDVMRYYHFYDKIASLL